MQAHEHINIQTELCSSCVCLGVSLQAAPLLSCVRDQYMSRPSALCFCSSEVLLAIDNQGLTPPFKIFTPTKIAFELCLGLLPETW